MKDRALTFSHQVSPIFLIFWISLEIALIMAVHGIEDYSDILVPIIIGGGAGAIGMFLAKYFSKYKIDNHKLLLPSGYRSKPYELSMLQSLRIRNNSLWQQMFIGKPPYTLELQFESSIPRHGQVELWTADPELIKQLGNYADLEFSQADI